MAAGKIGDETYARVLAVATAEPSFTGPYLAWLMGTSKSLTALAVERMRAERRVDLVEPAHGTYAAVYAVRPVRRVGAISGPRLELPDLDAGLGTGAPQRGSVVPLTGRASGPSGKPLRDRRKQAAGHRVKRA